MGVLECEFWGRSLVIWTLRTSTSVPRLHAGLRRHRQRSGSRDERRGIAACVGRCRQIPNLEKLDVLGRARPVWVPVIVLAGSRPRSPDSTRLKWPKPLWEQTRIALRDGIVRIRSMEYSASKSLESPRSFRTLYMGVSGLRHLEILEVSCDISSGWSQEGTVSSVVHRVLGGGRPSVFKTTRSNTASCCTEGC